MKFKAHKPTGTSWWRIYVKKWFTWKYVTTVYRERDIESSIDKYMEDIYTYSNTKYYTRDRRCR